MMKVAMAFTGGGIGAALRYWMDGAIQRATGSTLPYGTFVINSLGCLLIGVLMSGMEERFLGSPAFRIFLTVGVLGGFTTFSTFSYETIEMLRSAEYFYATANVAGTLVTCLAGTYAGMAIGKLL